ncbi:hypothetical protein CEQ21_23960 [Niallia circulans]|uniref:Uncharacterized protein n=1 Tax=Niallia circulans TaxID=1397 RepID=A0A553SN77_NIACI|nr:hypothetical protein [Niallia circulans]TRZ38449.1 hypothetical protein CEQ21_23960 [Niallia circulans]
MFHSKRLHGGAPVITAPTVGGVHVAPVVGHGAATLTGFVAPSVGFSAGNPTIIYPYKQFPAYMNPNQYPNQYYHNYPYNPYYPPYY